MSLLTILDRLISIEGVRTIAIAGREGLIIERAPQGSADAEALAAFGASALSAAEGLGAETQRAALIGLVLEYQDALISVDPLGELALTVTRIEAAAALVPLRQTLRQLRGEMLAALDAI